MAITYNAGTNTITVTGYTEATPCTFLDVYNADVAGGWGKVTRQCTNQYCIQAKIVIGDGSTVSWFGDSNVQLGLSSLFSFDVWTNIVFAVKTNAHFRLGEVTDAGKKEVKKGVHIHADWTTNYRCSFVDGETNSDAVELYGCCFSNSCEQSWRVYRCPGLKMWHCINTGVGGTYFGGIYISNSSDVDIYNYDAFNVYQTFTAVTGTMDDVKHFKGNKLVIVDQTTSTNAIIKNCVCKSLSSCLFRGYQSTYNCYLINVVSDNWAMTYNSYTGTVYRQYEVDLKVIDKDNTAINGATVKIWDKDSNLVLDTTTDASGVIATQTITRGYYNQANGSTLQEASPHLIKIEKAGYTTYEADFTLEDKTDWTIALQTSILRNPSMSGGMR